MPMMFITHHARIHADIEGLVDQLPETDVTMAAAADSRTAAKGIIIRSARRRGRTGAAER